MECLKLVPSLATHKRQIRRMNPFTSYANMTFGVNGCMGQIVALQTYYLHHNDAEMVFFLMLTLLTSFITLDATDLTCWRQVSWRKSFRMQMVDILVLDIIRINAKGLCVVGGNMIGQTISILFFFTFFFCFQQMWRVRSEAPNLGPRLW
jgi:hypothetical protein